MSAKEVFFIITRCIEMFYNEICMQKSSILSI